MRKSGWIITAIVLGLIGLAILTISLVWIIKDDQYFKVFSSLNSRTASELGGYLSGFVGIFWTGAGAILIYATFKIQQTQNEKQHFETTFFNLVNTYHNLINSTEGKFANYQDQKIETYKGREFFSAVLKKLKDESRSESFLKSICENKEIPEIREFLKVIEEKQKKSTIEIKPEWQIMDYFPLINTSNRSKEFVASQYEFVYRDFQSQLGHCFRFLYNIFKLAITERDKYGDTNHYISLIQAQMSNDELGLLFYNAISKYGKSSTGDARFYNWLNEFDFFENIDPDSLIILEHHRFYKTKFKFLNNREFK